MPLEPVGSGVTSILVNGTEEFVGEQTGDAQYDVNLTMNGSVSNNNYVSDRISGDGFSYFSPNFEFAVSPAYDVTISVDYLRNNSTTSEDERFIVTCDYGSGKVRTAESVTFGGSEYINDYKSMYLGHAPNVVGFYYDGRGSSDITWTVEIDGYTEKAVSTSYTVDGVNKSQ